MCVCVYVCMCVCAYDTGEEENSPFYFFSIQSYLLFSTPLGSRLVVLHSPLPAFFRSVSIISDVDLDVFYGERLRARDDIALGDTRDDIDGEGGREFMLVHSVLVECVSNRDLVNFVLDFGLLHSTGAIWDDEETIGHDERLNPV